MSSSPVASNEYAAITDEGNGAYVVHFRNPDLVAGHQRVRSLLSLFIESKKPGEKKRTLILDMSTVERLGSDMLGILILAHKKLHANGDNALVWTGANQHIHELLGVTGLNRVFQTTASLEQAVAQAHQPAIIDTIDGHIYIARPKQSHLITPDDIAAFREQLGRLIGPSRRAGAPCTLIIDAMRLEKVNPAFWQALIALDHQLRTTGNQPLIIANPNGEVKETIESQRFDQLFIVMPDLARAMVAASAPALPARMAG